MSVARYYPAFLDLQDKPVLVVGGGVVAERKVEQLLACGAAVRVVSPQATQAVAAWAAARQVVWAARPYQPADVQDAALVIAATDDPAVNRMVAADARAARVWVNAVDDAASCDFIAPAVIERGDITLAVSTGGKSPAMARLLRRHLSTFLSEDYARMLNVAEEVRLQLRREGLRVPPDAWQDALDDAFALLVQEGQAEAARQRLYANLTQVKVGR